VIEDPRYTRDDLDPEKRSKANAIEIHFKDGSSLSKVEVEYTIGHPRRRAEGIPMLETKFRKHLARRFAQKREAAILDLCMDQARLEATPVNEFLDRFVT
jgi:2-methylcitrate dehydratase